MKLLIIIAGRNDLKRSETIMSTKVMILLIADYFKTQPVLKAWLFGSFARGEETEDSDLDILVEYDKNARISLLTISHHTPSRICEPVPARGYDRAQG